MPPNQDELKRIEQLLEKEKRGRYGYRPTGAKERPVTRNPKRGRPPTLLKARKERILKILEGKKLKRQEIMSELGIRRKATFYEIADQPLDDRGQVFLEHDKQRDLWFLKSGQPRKRTMSQCKELNLLIKAIKDERLDFYVPRREFRDIVQAEAKEKSESALGIEPSESAFEATEELQSSPTVFRAGTVLPLLKEDIDRMRGAIYWHVEPVEKKPDGKKYSKIEKEETRELDQPKIKMLLKKCGSMSPSSFMYLIPEAFLLCYSKVDPAYFTNEKTLADISDEELDAVRSLAFGRSKRVSILYTFDVNEAFEWFKRHKSEKSIQDEFRSRFKEIREYLKSGDRLSEEWRKPRIHKRDLEHPPKFYPPRIEVDKTAGDATGDKLRLQDGERERTRRYIQSRKGIPRIFRSYGYSYDAGMSGFVHGWRFE